MTIQFYHYARCSTCVKARRFLEENSISFESIPIVDSPPSKTTLADIHRRSNLPMKALFNTSGQSYRRGDFKNKLPKMSDDEKLTALANDGKLIKRPLLVSTQGVLIGFKHPQWETFFIPDPHKN